MSKTDTVWCLQLSINLSCRACMQSYSPEAAQMWPAYFSFILFKNQYTTLLHYTRLTALFPGLPRWATTRKVKPIWILLKQETVSGSGISWSICKSAPHTRQITTPAPHHSVFFTGRMPFLSPNQQRQSTEGNQEPVYLCAFSVRVYLSLF